MYSIVLLAAMTASPDVPQSFLCPVTPSNYGSSLWTKHCFYECCLPARYGWVNCWNKGFGYYPGNARAFCGGCGPSFGPFYHPPACCGACGYGGGGGGYGGSCSFAGCGYGWGLGCRPAYYTSVTGCPPCVSAPPYAHDTERNPCCRYGHFAFDSGLIGQTCGVGYAGFGGYGNFGMYGAVPMQHPPTTADIPRFGPSPESYIPPTTTIQPGPAGTIPEHLIPKAPKFPPVSPIPDAKEQKDEPKKEKAQFDRALPSTVVLALPAGAKAYVNGQPLQSTAAERTFTTPALRPGQEYVYTVKAYAWVEGVEEEETREVRVTAGGTTRASFDRLLARAGGAPAVAGAGRQK